MIISCSYLSSKDKELTIKELNKTDVDFIHLDVMDNKFVSNETLDFNTLRSYFHENEKKLDIHLMVNNVKLFADIYSLLKPEYITFHLEVGNTLELINYIKNKNIKVGLAINPNTSIDLIKPFINDIDLVLIMSVYPGKGGQEFIESSIEKIKEIRKINTDINISIDGGINNETIVKAKDAGCSMFVVGSYITNNNISEKINELKNI